MGKYETLSWIGLDAITNILLLLILIVLILIMVKLYKIM